MSPQTTAALLKSYALGRALLHAKAGHGGAPEPEPGAPEPEPEPAATFELFTPHELPARWAYRPAKFVGVKAAGPQGRWLTRTVVTRPPRPGRRVEASALLTALLREFRRTYEGLSLVAVATRASIGFDALAAAGSGGVAPPSGKPEVDEAENAKLSCPEWLSQLVNAYAAHRGLAVRSG